jgi:hypothetical protein
MSKNINVRFAPEVAHLLDNRTGELRDLSVNAIVNLAVRRLLTSRPVSAIEADDRHVEAALRRILERDRLILEDLKDR